MRRQFLKGLAATAGVALVLGTLLMAIWPQTVDPTGTYYHYAGTFSYADQAGSRLVIQELAHALQAVPHARRYHITYDEMTKHAFSTRPRKLIAYNPRTRRLLWGDEENPAWDRALRNVTPAQVHAIARSGGDLENLHRLSERTRPDRSERSR